MKLSEVYEEWLPYKKRQVKKTTLCAYRMMWKSHLNGRWGNEQLSEINRKTVRAWAYEKVDSGLSVKTVKDNLIVLKMLLNFAADELELDVPSTTWKISWPTENREGKTLIETYTQDEVKKILAKTQADPSVRALALTIAFSTGLRIGELCGIQWADINLENKVIHVRRTVSRIYDFEFKKTEVFIGNTKTTSGTRDVPIVKNLLPTLKNWKKLFPDNYYLASGLKKPVEPRCFRCWYKEYVESLGITPLKFHAIRHTFATTLIDSGVDIKSVSSMLGHSDVSITMNIYVHPSDESKSRAVNKVVSKLF